MHRIIDGLDKRLISLLSREGRISTAEAAKRTGVSRATVASRFKSLITDGVVRTAALVDASKIDGVTTAFVGLTLDKFRLQETVDRVAALDEVCWAAVVTGRYDIIAEVVTERGMAGLYDFLNSSLMEVGGIASSEIFVVMKAAGKWSQLPRGIESSWAGESLEEEGVK